MPIPTPRSGENERDFISRCVSSLADIDPGMPNKQRVAVCYSQLRRSRGEEALHPDFERILNNYVKQYGESDGYARFTEWVKKHGLKPDKPYNNQVQLGECFGELCESFRWLDEPLISYYKSDDTGKYYKCVALTANVSMNLNDYSDVGEFKQAAGTLTWRPLNLNHDHGKFLPFPDNRVDYAAFEDNRVETIIRIDNTQKDVQRMIEDGEILHPSIEANPRGLTVTDVKTPSKWNYTALALLQRGVTLPGDPLTYLEPLPLNEAMGRSLVESLSMEREEEKVSKEKNVDGDTLTEETWNPSADWPDSCFMHVPAAARGASGKKSERKLPYKYPSGRISCSHVLAIIQSMGGARNEPNLPDNLKSRYRAQAQRIYKSNCNPDYKPSEDMREDTGYTGIDGIAVCGQCKFFEDLSNTTTTKPRATGQQDDAEVTTTTGAIGPGVGVCRVATELLGSRTLVRKNDPACTDGRARGTPTDVDRTIERIDLSEIEKEAIKADYEKRLADKDTLILEETQKTNREREAKLKAMGQVTEMTGALKDKERVIADLTGENSRLKDERQRLRGDNDALHEENAKLQIGITEKDADIKHYKDQYDAYKRTHKELSDSVVMLKEQLSRAIDVKNDATEKLAEANKRALNAEQERARIAEENVSLMEKITVMQRELYDSHNARSEAAKTYIRDSNRMQELTKEREQLVEEIRDLKQKLSTQPTRIKVKG